MGTQQFCLKWNNHQTNMLVVFEQLLSSEALVDVTLACEGLSLKAHKMVLSACSPFFQSLFLENPCKHPIVILKDMKYTDLKAIVDFMYRGEVNVSQDQLTALLKTAETLKVKGLAEVTGEQRQGASGVIQQEIVQQSLSTQAMTPSGSQQHRPESPPLSRRKRGRPRRRSLSDSNRSDTEDQVPSKIKEPDSPEVLEEISRDATSESSEVRQRLAAPNHPQTQVSIPHQSVLPVSNQKSISALPSVQDSHVTVEEPPSGDETEFEMEPSKLMEQTMTTDTVPVYSDGPSQGPTLPPVSNQLPISTTVGLVDTQTHHTPSGPCGDSQALVPCSMPSEPSTSSHITQDTTQDIKPGSLVSFEEPPISPVAGTSHQDSSSSMMMYMDTSVSMPGPSNYQLDKQQPQPQTQQPQPQEMLFLSREAELELMASNAKRGRKPGSRLCVACKKVFSSTANLEEHVRLGRCVREAEFPEIPQSLTITPISPPSNEPFILFPRDCVECKARLDSVQAMQDHLMAHKECRKPQLECRICSMTFTWPHTITIHVNDWHSGSGGVGTADRGQAPPRQWLCDICDKWLGSKQALMVHKQRLHNIGQTRLGDSGAEDSSPESGLRKRGRKPGSRVCTPCKKTFVNTKDFLLHHRQFHSGEEISSFLLPEDVSKQSLSIMEHSMTLPDIPGAVQQHQQSQDMTLVPFAEGSPPQQSPSPGGRSDGASSSLTPPSFL